MNRQVSRTVATSAVTRLAHSADSLDRKGSTTRPGTGILRLLARSSALAVTPGHGICFEHLARSAHRETGHLEGPDRVAGTRVTGVRNLRGGTGDARPTTLVALYVSCPRLFQKPTRITGISCILRSRSLWLRPSVTGLTGWLTLKWKGCEESKVALAIRSDSGVQRSNRTEHSRAVPVRVNEMCDFCPAIVDRRYTHAGM